MSDQKPRFEALDAAAIERIRNRHEELAQQAALAGHLIGAGRFGPAEQVLGEIEPLAKEFISETSFQVFRLLGQCARMGRRFEDAKRHYGWAFRLAKEFEKSDRRAGGNMLSIAIAGFASVAMAEEDLPGASRWYDLAVDLARKFSDGEGLASELQAYGEVLHRMGDDRAADLFREALGQPGLSAVLRAIILDNFSHELRRQDRLAEAIQHCRNAARLFDEAGADYHRYTALINLAAMARDIDPATSTQAFIAAHGLIHRIHGQIDVRHYTEGYARRVGAINDEILRRLADPDAPPIAHPDFDAILRDLVSRLNAKDPAHPVSHAGLRHALANQAAKASLGSAMRSLQAHHYADAESELRMAEVVWQNIGARHELLAVWLGLGVLYRQTGHYDQAHAVFDRTRMEAHGLGDASAEYSALLGLSRVASQLTMGPELDSLELLAQASALRDFIARSGRTAADSSETDGGTLDQEEFYLCNSYGAVELAERSLRRSIDIADRYRDEAVEHEFSRIRVTRRCELLHLLVEDGRSAEAGSVRAELVAINDSTTDPALRYPINSAIALTDLHAGEWTEHTLRRFRDGCAAFEELRPDALSIGESGYFGATATTHYLAAAELALHLGHPVEAFGLLERAKSRALLHALGNQRPSDAPDHPLLTEEDHLWNELRRLRSQPDQPDPGAPYEQASRLMERKQELDGVRRRLTELWDQLADDSPHVKAHRLAEPITAAEVMAQLGDATLVEFFVASRAIHAFTISASSITTQVVVTADDPDLPSLRPPSLYDETDDLFTNPMYNRLSQIVDDAAGDGAVYVVPHDDLHRLPLHLKAGATEARPRTYLLPSASTLRAKARSPRDGVALVAGDPTGDLPFARGECAHVAARLGAATPRFGRDVTADWLAAALREQPAGLVHLACHAEFNQRRPERSGLILAGADGQPGLVPLSELATLNWAGTLVVLSACRSGRHHVGTGDELAGLGRALLAAGATALVISFRRVPDLATALLMTWFYDQLRSLDIQDIGKALVNAQHRLRDTTAQDLITWAANDSRTADERTTFACRVVAAAHRAARNVDEYATWQHNVIKCRQGEPPPPDAWSRQTAIATHRPYQIRPFAAPTNWAAFAVLGAG